jgi:hypothetical protein
VARPWPLAGAAPAMYRPGSAPDADMAPPFEDIVKRPGRTSAYLRKFLDEDHFPMTTFRLFPHEKDDVVIYLNALRQP